MRAFSTVRYQARTASKFEVRTTKCANRAGEIASGRTASRGRRVMSGVASMIFPPIAARGGARSGASDGTFGRGGHGVSGGGPGIAARAAQIATYWAVSVDVPYLSRP